MGDDIMTIELRMGEDAMTKKWVAIVSVLLLSGTVAVVCAGACAGAAGFVCANAVEKLRASRNAKAVIKRSIFITFCNAP